MGNFEISREISKLDVEKERNILKVVVSLHFDFVTVLTSSRTGDDDEMVRVWKVGGPGECMGSLSSRSEV